MAFGTDLNERLSAYEGLIHAVSMERGIKHAIGIAVDEWSPGRQTIGSNREVPINIARDERGVMHLSTSNREVHNPRGRNAFRLEDALVTGLYLNAFIRHANSVRMAIFMPIPTGGFMSLDHPEKPLVLQTIFYPFELYSRTCGHLALDLFWQSDTFSGTYGNRTYSGIRTLDVSATLNEAQKQLVVYVVNQSKDKAMETTVSLTHGEFTGDMKVSIINGLDIKAENTEETPNQVAAKEVIVKAAGKSLTCAFEPHSVTALVCTIS
jgi:alpha-N-arabinofuranosidase